MSARGLEIQYTEIREADAWPLQPWAALARAEESEAGVEAVPVDGTAEATVRKARDRGASAVEWVVITAIVVAIVTGVGVLIAKAVQDKAKSACNQIANTNTVNTSAGIGGGSGGGGCG